jgi:Fe-S-cluster containining protein
MAHPGDEGESCELGGQKSDKSVASTQYDCESCAFLNEDQLCRIYATRPDVCRRFEAGSEQCIEARARAGINT